MLKLLTRLLVLVLGGLYAGVSCALAAHADEEGRSLVRWFLLEMRRTDALQQRNVEIAETLEARRAITEELIDGRLTFREAIKQFRDANAIVQANREGLVATYYLPTTDEGVARQVIAWVRLLLEEEYPARDGEATLRRLEKELETQFPSTAVLD